MSAIHPSSLDSAALARRLGELVGDERKVQVEFLLHLDEFDRRRAYLEAGFGSLWDYCLRCLHLREGAAGRRIGAMRVLRRLPRLESALRDGRLCLSTVSLLGQVLTDENLDDLVVRAAYRTKTEVEHVVASLQSRTAPKEGIRKLAPRAPSAAVTPVLQERDAEPVAPAALVLASVPPAPAPLSRAEAPEPPAALAMARPRPSEVRPVSEDEWSVRVTLDAAGTEELDTLKALLSHKFPDGNLADVLREAIRCGIEKHGKRLGANSKGAPAPAEQRDLCTPVVAPRKVDTAAKPNAPRGAVARHVPAAVRREVWKRDGGACSWKSEDGRRCGSTWQLEVDHILPLLLGGSSDPANLRLLCRRHNILHAEHVYGREHMDRFKREAFTVGGDRERAGAP